MNDQYGPHLIKYKNYESDEPIHAGFIRKTTKKLPFQDYGQYNLRLARSVLFLQ